MNNRAWYLQRSQIVAVTALWWLLVAVLSVTRFNQFQVLNIVGFPFLVFVPGLLTVLALRLEKLDFWGIVGLSVGFSVLELMLVGLFGNTLLHALGVLRPLGLPILLTELTLLGAGLLLTIWYQNRVITIPRWPLLIFHTYGDLLTALFPALFVLMSVFGAIRLNNGTSGILTLIMLGAVALYLTFLMYRSNRVGPNVIPVALFFIALSLLSMTSLRGWFITGHDIQREFRVLEVTNNNALWSIGSFRDAYNACLSITILPTIFSAVLKIFNPYIYKILFQILFAVLPGICYLIVRRYFSPRIALISTVYFLAFPTFFGDMPFLNRQEIAFLFLGLMLYVLYEHQITLRLRRILFCVLGVGMVVSHYTTTYTVIAVLLFLVIARPVYRWVALRLHARGKFANSSFASLHAGSHEEPAKITVGMVAILVFVAFVWSSLITDTASASLGRVLRQTVEVIKSNTKEDARSGDVTYNLFSWTKIDLTQQLALYKKDVVAAARRQALPGTYFPESAYDSYPTTVVTKGTLPLTVVGQAMAHAGIDVAGFNYVFRQGSAKLLQLLILVGLLAALVSRRFNRRLFDADFILLTAGSLVFVASQIVLPVLSSEYGVLRAFEQSIVFFGCFIVVGSLSVPLGAKMVIREMFAGALAIVFLLSSTGFITQTLGGYDPQLHLNNGGVYYDNYYLHASEVTGIEWLAAETQGLRRDDLQFEVQTDRFAVTKVNSISALDSLNDIFPGLIRTSSFVYLGYANVHKQQATLSFNGNNITYTLPVRFLDDHKSLIYSSGGVNIYR